MLYSSTTHGNSGRQRVKALLGCHVYRQLGSRRGSNIKIMFHGFSVLYCVYCVLQRIPNDVILCSVYTSLALISKDARLFHDLEVEELRHFQLRDNATLIDSIRNLTHHSVYGLETQLQKAKWMLLRTGPRGRMCVRTVFQTVGRLDPVLRVLAERPPKYRNGRQRHRRQMKRARKIVRLMRYLRETIQWQLRARGISLSAAFQ